MSNITRRAELRNGLLFPIEQQFDRFFNSFFEDFLTPNMRDVCRATTGYPKVDATSTESEFILRAAVPGVTRDNLKVEIEDSTLTLSGEMNDEYRHDEENSHIRELHKSRFSRTIQLPENVEGDPEAKLKDGILELKWKTREAPKPKAKLIEVKQE